MPSPDIRSYLVSTQASGTDFSVGLPASIEEVDTVFVAVISDNTPSIAYPGGWAPFTQIQDTFNRVTMRCAWLKAVGDEGSTSISVTLGSSQAVAALAYSISGAADPDTQPPEGGGGADGFDDSPDSPNVLPTGGSKDYLALSIAGHDTIGNLFTAFPSGYSIGQVQGAGGSGAGCSYAAAWAQATASSFDPGVFTMSSGEDWIADTFVFHPASSASVGTGKIIQQLIGERKLSPADAGLATAVLATTQVKNRREALGALSAVGLLALFRR